MSWDIPLKAAPIAIAYAALCLIWGTTWLGVKITLQYVPPMTGVGIRFFIAGLVVLAVAALWKELLPVRNLPWKLVLVLAIFLIGLNYVLQYIAETRIASGLTAVLCATMPFSTFFFGHYLAHERTTPRIWGGAVLAFVGVTLIALTEGVSGSWLYALAAVAAAAFNSLGNVYFKRHSGYSALGVLGPAMLLSGSAITILGVLFEHPDFHRVLEPVSLGVTFYLAVFGSGLALFLNLWLLRHVTAWLVSFNALVIPVIAVIAGTLFGNETFGLRELLGAALVVLGASIAILSARRSDNPLFKG